MENIERDIPEIQYVKARRVYDQKGEEIDLNGGRWYKPIGSHKILQLTNKTPLIVIEEIYMDRCECFKAWNKRCPLQLILVIHNN